MNNKKIRKEIFNQFKQITEKENSIPVIMIHGIPSKEGGVMFRISHNSILAKEQMPAIFRLLEKWIKQEKNNEIIDDEPVNIEDTKNTLTRNQDIKTLIK